MNPYDDLIKQAADNECFWEYELERLCYLSNEWEIIQGILKLCLTGK